MNESENSGNPEHNIPKPPPRPAQRPNPAPQAGNSAIPSSPIPGLNQAPLPEGEEELFPEPQESAGRFGKGAYAFFGGGAIISLVVVYLLVFSSGSGPSDLAQAAAPDSSMYAEATNLADIYDGVAKSRFVAESQRERLEAFMKSNLDASKDLSTLSPGAVARDPMKMLGYFAQHVKNIAVFTGPWNENQESSIQRDFMLPMADVAIMMEFHSSDEAKAFLEWEKKEKGGGFGSVSETRMIDDDKLINSSSIALLDTIQARLEDGGESLEGNDTFNSVKALFGGEGLSYYMDYQAYYRQMLKGFENNRSLRRVFGGSQAEYFKNLSKQMEAIQPVDSIGGLALHMGANSTTFRLSHKDPHDMIDEIVVDSDDSIFEALPKNSILAVKAGFNLSGYVEAMENIAKKTPELKNMMSDLDSAMRALLREADVEYDFLSKHLDTLVNESENSFAFGIPILGDKFYCGVLAMSIDDSDAVAEAVGAMAESGPTQTRASEHKGVKIFADPNIAFLVSDDHLVMIRLIKEASRDVRREVEAMSGREYVEHLCRLYIEDLDKGNFRGSDGLDNATTGKVSADHGFFVAGNIKGIMELAAGSSIRKDFDWIADGAWIGMSSEYDDDGTSVYINAGISDFLAMAAMSMMPQR